VHRGLRSRVPYPGPPSGGSSPREVPRVLKKLALVAVVAGVLAAVKKRAGSNTDTDLWHEATRGPDAVSTPSAR